MGRRVVLCTEDDMADNTAASSEGANKITAQCENVEFMEPYEAFVRCMRKHSKIDMPFLMSMTGKTLEELVEGLNLYQDPVRYDVRREEMEDWYSLSSYLYNKHIPRLYKEAKQMNEKYPGRFTRNIKVLEENYPKLPGLTAYDLPIGCPWIPDWLYGEILKKLLELCIPPKVSSNEETRRYTVQLFEKIAYVIDHVKYGTTDKGISEGLTALFNLEEQVVKDQVMDGNLRQKSIRNDAKTMAYINKLKVFESDYYSVLAEYLLDADIYEEISRRYCESIGGYLSYKIRCDWVSVPGLKGVLRNYQKDGVGMACMNPCTFFNWGTGAGKSLGMLAAASEFKRLEICKKILFVIPNGSLENFVLEIEKYYPDKNYLVIYPRLFSQKKEYYLDLIKNHGDEYEAIVMAESSYTMLDLSKTYYLQQVEQNIRRTKAAINTEMAGNAYGDDIGILKRRLKLLEKKKEELEAAVPKITDCFEQLGIEALLCDECQEFKNVSLKCGYSHITGVTIKGSPKCDKHMEKVHWILKNPNHPDGRVVFATATPQKNSISETYVYQKYLSEEELEYAGIHSFQEWMKNFTETETKPGVAQDLQSMNLQTRLKYHNLTDLHGMMSTFMNYYQVDKSELKLPKHGPYVDVVIPATDEEIEKFEEIAQKLKDVHEGILTPKEYNPLMATIEGRATSLDIRLTKKDAKPRLETTKSWVCSANVYKYYRAYPGTTQVIYCDQSVPKETFNLYDEMKKYMIQFGIPEEEIAFIHDGDNPYKKMQILDDFQNGKIRVLIGSTKKMGTGLNIHRKLKVAHHLDCPYSPADLIQRNGRLVRHGNENEEVIFVRYIKERSYDAVSWDRVVMKQVWIETFNSPLMNENQRDMEDLADNALSYGEAVAYALGKPEMKMYVETENELKRVTQQSRKRAKEIQELREMTAKIPDDLAKRERFISIIETDQAYYKKHKASMTDQERKDFGTSLLNAIQTSREGGKPKNLVYQGFTVVIPELKAGEEVFVRLRSPGGGIYRVKMDTDKSLGCCQILNYYLGTQLARIKERHEKQCMTGRQNMRHAWSEIEKGNPYIRKIEELREKLQVMGQEMERVS